MFSLLTKENTSINIKKHGLHSYQNLAYYHHHCCCSRSVGMRAAGLRAGRSGTVSRRARATCRWAAGRRASPPVSAATPRARPALDRAAASLENPYLFTVTIPFTIVSNSLYHVFYVTVVHNEFKILNEMKLIAL